MKTKNQTVTEACDSTRRNTRSLIYAELREKIDLSIADLAKWEPHRENASFVTTAADVRIEYHRIFGMINALEAIGGTTYGLWAALQRAKIAACGRCPEIEDVLNSGGAA